MSIMILGRRWRRRPGIQLAGSLSIACSARGLGWVFWHQVCAESGMLTRWQAEYYVVGLDEKTRRVVGVTVKAIES